jgi:hypothetical protein
MALQLSFNDRFGSTHASAYHRVVAIEMDVSNRYAKVKIATYKDLAARNADKSPLEHQTYTFSETAYDDLFDATNMNPVDKNPVKNVYDHIKTLPEWSAASDV